MDDNGTEQQPQRDGIVDRIVGWLRAGYPDGVPQQDYVALLGILQRNMTPSELETVVLTLAEDAEARQALVTREVVEQRIADVLKGPATPDDVARVSARLAAAGWPLGVPSTDASGTDPSSTGVVTRVVDWLRKGYPSGLPTQDFIPLVALLRRRLTEEEVSQVARDLVSNGMVPADRVDVGAGIVKVTSELPSDTDIERVRAYLSDHGWPLQFPV